MCGLAVDGAVMCERSQPTALRPHRRMSGQLAGVSEDTLRRRSLA